MEQSKTIAEHVRDNLELVMKYHGWHNRDVLAKLLRPVSDSTLNGWKTSGTRDFLAITELADVIGWPPKVLAGFYSCEERDHMLAHQIWNPMSSKGAAEFALALREQLGKAKQVLSLMQEIPCSWMTENILDCMYESYFAPVGSTSYGRSLKREYKKFGHAQRERFDKKGTPVPNNMLALIPRCDFEKLVKQKRPFDSCEPEEVLECIGRIRALSQDRRIAFSLIETPSVYQIPEVRAAYGSVDSVVVVDDAFTFRRDIESIEGEMFPRLLRWSTDAGEIAKAKGIVAKFLSSGAADFRPQMLAELDSYEQLLES